MGAIGPRLSNSHERSDAIGGPADNPHLILRSSADLGHSLSDGDGSNSKSLTLSISQFNAPRLAEPPS
jgi:hypothetical protein